MFETLGSHSRQTFHISMQNGSHMEISWKRNFDSHRRIKNYGTFPRATRAQSHGDPLPNTVYIAIWMPPCTVWLSMWYNLFLLSALKKK